MPKIYWYGPKDGQQSTHHRVAYTRPVANALKEAANDIARDAAFLLDSRAQHRTGDARIETIHYGDPALLLDSYVLLRDPNNKGAAQGIENGHWTKGYRWRRDGTLGGDEGPIRNGEAGDGGGSRWVPGLHVLRDAADKATTKG